MLCLIISKNITLLCVVRSRPSIIVYNLALVVWVHIIVLPISSRSELLNPLEQNLLLTSGQRRTFDNSNLTNIDDS
jgi:hypothetical protein